MVSVKFLSFYTCFQDDPKWSLIIFTSFFTKNKFSYLCKLYDQTLFSLFLSTILHSSSFHFCSSFFLHKFCGFSTSDDHGRLNTQSIEGSTPSKTKFELWSSIFNRCECSTFSSILFSIFMIMNGLKIENELV